MTALPTPVGEFDVLPSRPADVGNLGDDLRGVATALVDVDEWVGGAATPVGWSGDAAQAADRAREAFARRAGLARTALEAATVATTRFEDRLVRLRANGAELDRERGALNQAIAQAEELAAGGPPEPALVIRLHDRAARLRADIAAWEGQVADAEAAYVTALRGVDTLPEVRVAATMRAPDTGALLRHLTGLVGDAGSVAAWWRALPLAQRQALILARPSYIGGIDGIPITGRDRANRAGVDAERGYLLQRQEDGLLSTAEQHALANLDAVQQVIDLRRHDVDPVTGRGLFNIIKYDPWSYGGDGTSIVSLGNPDHAAHVATYTPGFTTDGGKLDDLGRIDDLHTAMVQPHDRSVATVLYEDYDAPSLDEIHHASDLFDPFKTGVALGDGIGVASTVDAQAGGHRLAGFLAGLDVTRRHHDVDVTVIGHSYGSVLAAYATQDASPLGTHVLDDTVLLANPGVPGHDVHDLVGDSGVHVYVGADDHDPVSLLGHGPLGGPGTLGTDPAAATYGAHRIGEQTGPETFAGVAKFHNHSSSSYLGAGTEGLRNVAAVATGRQPEEVPGRDDGNYESLGDLVAHALLNTTPWGLDNRAYDGGGKQVLHALDALPGPVKHAVIPAPLSPVRVLLDLLKGMKS